MQVNHRRGKLGFIIMSNSWGGLEINVLKLANKLSEENWEIHLFVKENTRISKEPRHNAIQIQYITPPLKYFDFWSAFSFSRTLKKNQLKTLWIFNNRDLDFAFFVKLFFSNLKIIYQQHMQIGISKRDLVHTIRFGCIDYWITPLETLKNEIIFKTKFDSEKLKIIPLGTEIEKFTTRHYSKQNARNRLNIPQNATIVGILGRIDPGKGQLFLTEAIEKIHQQYPSVQLLIMGEKTFNYKESEQYMHALETFIETHNLKDIIHIRGFNNDVSLFYNAVDIFALASKGETYGMVTIEAMLSGLPVIATNTSGTPEILNYGEYGVLYTHNDIDDFVEKLTRLLLNQDESELMAHKGQQAAIGLYSISHEYDLIEKEVLKPIYLEIV